MSLGQILLLIVLYTFVLQIVAAGLALIQIGWLWRSAALVEAGFLAWLWRHVRMLGGRIGLRPFSPREAAWVVLWLNAVALFNDAALVWLLPAGLVDQYLRPFRPGGTGEWLGLAAVAILLAPAIEEILFRGLLLWRLEEIGGKRFAVLATTTLFALVHTLPLQILAAIVPGLLLAAYRANGGSLYVTFLAHASGNTVSFLGLVFPGTPWISVSWEPPFWSGVLALLLTPLLAWSFLRRYPF